jgi:hypothetical protein
MVSVEPAAKNPLSGLEDQNRLLAGLPPLPREDIPDVIKGGQAPPRR